MTVPHDILARVKASGAQLILKPDGTGIKARNISVGLLDEVRQHKQEIIELLKANSIGGIAVPVSKFTKPQQYANSDTDTTDTVPAKTYSRLELANAALTHLIPDVQARRKIRALAEADARGWRFLGADGYQHVLAGSIMDQVERATGNLICFVGSDESDRFGGWFCKEIKP